MLIDQFVVAEHEVEEKLIEETAERGDWENFTAVGYSTSDGFELADEALSTQITHTLRRKLGDVEHHGRRLRKHIQVVGADLREIRTMSEEAFVQQKSTSHDPLNGRLAPNSEI